MQRIEWEMEQGRTLSWLAEELGLSVSQVSRMLKGERRWTEESLVRAGRALGVEPNDLLVEVETCEKCKGYGTMPVLEDGKQSLVICDVCENGVVPVDGDTTGDAAGGDCPQGEGDDE